MGFLYKIINTIDSIVMLLCFVIFCRAVVVVKEENIYCLQCFDAVGWVAGRASGL